MTAREKKILEFVNSERGRLGYLLAWLLGIPASVLLIIFLVRGG